MMPKVTEFYSGKCILITGATGFVGKALVDKLLRDCWELDTIYLLLRQKKGLSSEERLKDLCNNKLFDVLRAKHPDFMKKLKVIAGDILEDQLGISDKDRQELQEKCNLIFHSAACVRFDQNLKDAVNLNVRGTLRMLQLGETIKNLEAFVHLSTAYCRCELDVLEEKLYPAMHKPAHIMDMVEWMDDSLLEHVEKKLIGTEPNTYSYTKAITEDLVAEYTNKFPIAIARPSIVIAAWKEPIPGWVDNMNGATGLVIGSGKGVIRTMHCEPTYVADAMPVDVVVNGCIIIGYVTALDKLNEAVIYNITLSGVINMMWGQIIELGKKWVNVYPHTIALWYPGGTIKSYWLTHQLCLIFLHLLPAYLLDLLLFMLGRKTLMVKIQKRISHGLNVLQYYTTKEWHFRNTNFKGLRKRITKSEDEVFFTDVSDLSPDEYLKDYILGAREYVCKDPPSTLARARKLHRVRYYADVVVKILFYALLAWWLYSYSHIFKSSVQYLDTTLKNWSPFESKTIEKVEILST